LLQNVVEQFIEAISDIGTVDRVALGLCVFRVPLTRTDVNAMPRWGVAHLLVIAETRAAVRRVSARLAGIAPRTKDGQWTFPVDDGAYEPLPEGLQRSSVMLAEAAGAFAKSTHQITFQHAFVVDDGNAARVPVCVQFLADADETLLRAESRLRTALDEPTTCADDVAARVTETPSSSTIDSAFRRFVQQILPPDNPSPGMRGAL